MTDGSITAVGTEMRSYYGRPILKEPVWQPEIPWYFFAGGLAGASSILGLAARAGGNEPLAKAGLYISALGEGVSPVLLISDLGRPERFLNMLRVFKVTSPMSVGTWILTASGTATALATGLELLDRAPRLKVLAEAASALLGAPLSVYTAVLVSDTAIPVWHEARRELPFVFGASSVASAGAAAAVVVAPEYAGPARRLAVGGVAAGNVAMLAMQARLGMVGEPYRKGEAGKYHAIAKVCTAAGAALLARSAKQSRLAAVVGGGLVLAGEAALRWSVFRAGFQSARDPKYVVEPQRERIRKRNRT
jgi:formate-dependent nitrite reductase membrane component NrfD